MAVVPGCHELSSKDTISLSELQKYPFIVYSTGENDESEAGWPGIATGNSIKWDIMYSCKDDMAAMNMVGHELGVTIAASLMLGQLSIQRQGYFTKSAFISITWH